MKKDGLRRARDEWELKTKTMEDVILARVESRLSVIQQRDGHPFMNRFTKLNGQESVTPPRESPQPVIRFYATEIEEEAQRCAAVFKRESPPEVKL